MFYGENGLRSGALETGFYTTTTLPNAVSHFVLTVPELVAKSSATLVPLPPYSPGVTPCEILVFQNSNYH
jgi:hypothetical protein